jgi:hypothetical protein
MFLIKFGNLTHFNLEVEHALGESMLNMSNVHSHTNGKNNGLFCEPKKKLKK